MKYAEAKKRIRSGDLLAWSHRSWSSFYDLQVQAVRVFTQSEYCHVGIAWVVGERTFVLEAVKPKSRVHLLSQLGTFYWVPTDVTWTPTVEDYALSLLGIPYSTRECIVAYFTDHALTNIDRMQCAKMAQLILAKAGVDLTSTKSTPSAVVSRALELFDDLILVTPT